jgi:hypothetical protein
LFQWASTIIMQLACWSSTKWISSSSHLELTCSCHDIAQIYCWVKQQSLTHSLKLYEILFIYFRFEKEDHMDNSLLIIVDHKHQILSILTQINYGSNTEQISLYPDVDSMLHTFQVSCMQLQNFTVVWCFMSVIVFACLYTKCYRKSKLPRPLLSQQELYRHQYSQNFDFLFQIVIPGWYHGVVL